MASLLLVFSLQLLTVEFSDAGSLVGPGAVGSYQGGGGGRRYGGSVRVQDPPHGIFIAGSSLREMNGIYGKVDSVPSTFKRSFHYAYRHDYTGWYIALVESSEGERVESGKKSQWMLISNDAEERFRCEGDTLIPGSGPSWGHMHDVATAESDAEAGTAVGTATEDDPEELPWQVIGIGSEDMLKNLRHHFRYYKHTVQQALSGENLPRLPNVPASQREERPPLDFRAPSVLDDGLTSELCDFDESTALRDALKREAATRSVGHDSQSESSHEKWGQAVLHLNIATCYRWRREFELSEASLLAAQRLFPLYERAFLEFGFLNMDRGRHDEATESFEYVTRLDREFTGIDGWLVRAHVHKEREKRRIEERRSAVPEGLSATSYCVAWRQTGGCDPAGPREEHADQNCLATVASGSSGYCECLTSSGEVAQASQSVCKHTPIRCEDVCRARWLDEEKVPPPKAVGASSDEHPCDGLEPPTWCSSDHYYVVGIRCDMPDAPEGEELDELKRAFKRRSLQVHPDKRGGSAEAFQKVAAAHDVLRDPVKRAAYDQGEEIPREKRHDNTDGLTFKDQILKRYFPDRYDLELFGDPHGDRKEIKRRKSHRLEQQRQAALARGEKTEL